jgi:hypothetical protein
MSDRIRVRRAKTSMRPSSHRRHPDQTATHLQHIAASALCNIVARYIDVTVCVADLAATNRIVGRVTASQIAAASAASFLFRFT